jgi:hypothetical protein
MSKIVGTLQPRRSNLARNATSDNTHPGPRISRRTVDFRSCSVFSTISQPAILQQDAAEHQQPGMPMGGGDLELNRLPLHPIVGQARA